MECIVIINQHKGDIRELFECINNFKDVTQYESRFIMYLVVDMKIDNKTRYKLENLIDSKLRIIFNDDTIGLTKSRLKAMRAAISGLSDYNINGFIFGCTNSRFNCELKYLLIVRNFDKSPIVLYPCNYDNPLWTRDYSCCGRSYSLGEYLSLENRPDFTIAVKYFKGILMCYPSYYDEKYTSEDLFLYNYMIGYLKWKDTEITQKNSKIYISKYIFQDAWYNSTGMSMNFHRNTILENRKGFAKRSYTYLMDPYNIVGDLSSDQRKQLEEWLLICGSKFQIENYLDKSKCRYYQEFNDHLLNVFMNWRDLIQTESKG